MPSATRFTATAQVPTTDQTIDPASPDASPPTDTQPGWTHRPIGRSRLLAAAVVAALTLLGAGTVFAAAARAQPRTQPEALWQAARSTVPTAPGTAAMPSLSTPPTATGTAAKGPIAYTIPGARPQLPWPSTGQATVEVEGLGSLGSSGPQHPAPIASITKVMTAYLVLRDHPLSATGDGPVITVTPAEAAAYAQEKADNESLVPVAAGEQLTERQALIALLLPSADNIARILARWDAGSIPTFLSRMNSMAGRLGMVHTRYTDPSGYDETTISTPSDQVTLAERALSLPTFAAIVALRSASIPLAGTVHNYNTLLGTDGITGIKTGSTTAAGGCLLFAATHTVAGHSYTIIGAVLGQPGSTMHGLPQALAASDRLVRAATAALHTYTLIKAGQQVGHTSTGQPLIATQPATVSGWPGLTYHTTVHPTSSTTATLTLTAGTTTVTINLTTS